MKSEALQNSRKDVNKHTSKSHAVLATQVMLVYFRGQMHLLHGLDWRHW